MNKFIKIIGCGALTTLGLLESNLYAKDNKILPLLNKDRYVKILKAYNGKPDRKGTLEKFVLKTPKFVRGVYYRGQWWPYAGNRVSGKGFVDHSELREGGIFALLKLTDGRYLAILPLSGDNAYAYLSPQQGEFHLKLATFGTAEVKGDIPLVCTATGVTPYEACARVWEKACNTPQIKGWMKLREKKPYPEMFKYLGWCSWEGYRKNISSHNMVEELNGLSDSEVPVRYLLVDDGHFDVKTLKPDAYKFPEGYKPLTNLRSEEGIKWVGMWHALLGESNGMPKGCPAEIADSMMECHNGQWVPKPDAQSIEKFMNYLLEHSVKDDIDFVKVDFCGSLLPYYAGSKGTRTVQYFPPTSENAIANPSQATALYSRIYQKVVAENFKGLMNCNWQSPQFIFNSGDSSVGRCSADYAVGNIDKAKSHLFDSYNKIPWLGQIYWGDHDMFHSSDKFAGRMMAISKAMSGGPIYLSDKYHEIVAEHVMPLCYEDGLLLRPLAPAAPVGDDIFANITDNRLYRTMAPLVNKTAVFAVYNLHGTDGDESVELETTLGNDEYCSVAEMMQPYKGKWILPEEGLVVYDHATRIANKIDGKYTFSLKGFSDRLIQISPITNGWSVIGRTDKYLSAAAVKILSNSSEKITLQLHEAGPFGIWLNEGEPVAKGVTFFSEGNGYYLAKMPVSETSVEIEIRRK